MNSRKRPITSGHSPPESKRSRSLALDHVDDQYAVSPDGRRGSVPPTFEATRRIEPTSGRADRYDGYRSSENTRLGPPAHRMSTDVTTMLRTQGVGSPQQHYVASPASIHGESAHNRSGNSTPQSTMAPPQSTTLATQAKQTAPSSKASADFAKLSTYNQVYSYLKTEGNKAKLKQEYGQIPYPPNVSSLRRLRDQKLQLAQNEYNGAKKKFPAELTVSRGGMDHASNVPTSTDEQEMFYKTRDSRRKLRTALDLLDTKFQALGSSTRVIDMKPSTGDIDITTLRAEIARFLGPVEEKQTKLESTIARQEDALQKVLDNWEGLQSTHGSPRKLTDSFRGTQTSSPTEESSRKPEGFDRNREHAQQSPHTPQSHDIPQMRTRFESTVNSQQLKSLQSQQEQSATSIAAQQVLIETVQRTLSELNADVKKWAVNPDSNDENSVTGILKRLNALAEFQKNAEKAVEVHNEAVARVDQEAKAAKSLAEKNRDDVASIDQKIKELPVDLASRFETMHAAFTSDAVFKKTKKESESELTLQFANFTTIIDSKLDPTIARNDEIDKRVSDLEQSRTQTTTELEDLSDIVPKVETLEKTVIHLAKSFTTAVSNEEVLGLKAQVNQLVEDISSTSSLAGRVQNLETKATEAEDSLSAKVSIDKFNEIETRVSQCAQDITNVEENVFSRITTMDQALRKSIESRVSQCADDITAAQRALSAKIDDTEQALRDRIKELVSTAETSVATWDASIRELTSLVEDTKTEFKSDVAETNSKVNSIDSDVSKFYDHAEKIRPATQAAVNIILEQVEAAEVEFKNILSSLEKRQSEQAEDIVRLKGSRTISQQSRSVSGVVDSQNSLEDSRENMVHASQYNDLQERVKAWKEFIEKEINAIRTNQTQLDQRVNDAVTLASGSAGQVNALTESHQQLKREVKGGNENIRHAIWDLRSRFDNITTEELYHKIVRVVANTLPNAPEVISQLQGGLSEVRLQTEKLQKDIRGLENTAASSDHLHQLLEKVTNVENTLANWRADISSISDLRTENIEVSDRARSGLDLAQGLETRVNDLSSQCAELTESGGKSAQNALKKMRTTIDQLRTELEDRVKLIETKIAAVERNASQIPVLELKVGELKTDTEESFRELGQCVTGFRYPLGEGHFGPQGEPTPPKSTPTGPRRGRRPGQACSDNS